MDKLLWGVRVQAPFGAVVIGTWAVLSSIPEGACVCGAEERMASIGPVGPRCQGLCRKVASLRSGGSCRGGRLYIIEGASLDRTTLVS